MPLRSFCPNLEELAEKPASALGDDDRIRLGDALQARRKVWGFTHDPAFLGLPGADEIADHHQPGRYANADLQRLLDAQPADCLDQCSPCPDRALRIVLVGLGIAEIDEHPVTHVLGHEPVEPRYRRRDAFVIGADHGAQVLGVELGRERSRTNEIDEHHSQLATFGGVLRHGYGRGSRLGRSRSSARKPGNRGLQLAPMTEQYSEIF